ncbi:LysM peptidoglycan-binding domain-containing protein [Telmatospirillum sp. J64-1]|uniref:LysM peptidoglycan-binding domain-containing protein n=1 Tax=Telmatospirillum sp. J64-1 TaxID=2502183 RepID=UPI00115E2517|nr:LysM peptidoglycan-binding domain-containing protein [Telmatospirillum sp. J64-1]
MKRPSVLILAGAAVLAVAVALSVYRAGEEETEPVTATVQPAAPLQAEPTPVEEAVDSAAPSFDVVRVNPAGDAVMAGRAQPHAEVTILDGDQEIGSVTADQRGEWVFVPDAPLPPGSRSLGLRSVDVDGTTHEAEARVVLMVPDSPNADTALAVRIGPDGARLLQGPAGQEDRPEISIEVIDRQASGNLALGGKAKPGSGVHVYLDNRFVGRAEADAEGEWSMAAAMPEGQDPSVLRGDQVAADGKVTARVELPFPRAPRQSGGERPAADRTVVVEAGASLWQIARQAYGRGFDYTVIYQANREQIRDPNLIYPGQVFKLPSGQE